MVKPELAKGLKALSRKRETSVDEPVRHAVLSYYKLESLDLSEQQRRAVNRRHQRLSPFGLSAIAMPSGARPVGILFITFKDFRSMTATTFSP
jgi:hypothetical protein